MLHLGRVDFRMQQSCDGCVMTTIEPITPERGQVPIRTLARHRTWDGAVWFGGWLILLATAGSASTTTSRPSLVDAAEHRGPPSLASPGEGDLPGGCLRHRVRRVVGASVVPWAQQHPVPHARCAAAAPRDRRVGVAEPGRPVTVIGDASALLAAHRDPLRPGVEPGPAAQVEHLALATQDDGDDRGLTRQPPGSPALTASPCRAGPPSDPPAGSTDPW